MYWIYCFGGPYGKLWISGGRNYNLSCCYALFTDIIWWYTDQSSLMFIFLPARSSVGKDWPSMIKKHGDTTGDKDGFSMVWPAKNAGLFWFDQQEWGLMWLNCWTSEYLHFFVYGGSNQTIFVQRSVMSSPLARKSGWRWSKRIGSKGHEIPRKDIPFGNQTRQLNLFKWCLENCLFPCLITKGIQRVI